MGNPGSKYDGTRHNIGFEVVDELAARWGIKVAEKRFAGLVGDGSVEGVRALLLKPQTFMNRSGNSAGPAAGFYKLPPQQLIVIHDELELPLGRLRLKQGGGHGGHNGLRSLDVGLPNKSYYRVRLGVDRPAHGTVSSWVLSQFAAAERPLAREIVLTGADAVEALLRDGLEAAQNRYHPLDLRPPAPAP